MFNGLDTWCQISFYNAFFFLGFKSLAILILVLLCMFENAKHQTGLKTITIADMLILGY